MKIQVVKYGNRASRGRVVKVLRDLWTVLIRWLICRLPNLICLLVLRIVPKPMKTRKVNQKEACHLLTKKMCRLHLGLWLCKRLMRQFDTFLYSLSHITKSGWLGVENNTAPFTNRLFDTTAYTPTITVINRFKRQRLQDILTNERVCVCAYLTATATKPLVRFKRNFARRLFRAKSRLSSFKEQDRLKRFKMAANWSILTTTCLEKCIIFYNQSHWTKAAKNYTILTT